LPVDEDFRIARVKGHMVLDSRGRPTVKAVVETRRGRGYGYAPSGASRGAREALEVRDGGKRWMGYGVERALSALESQVAPRLVGLDARRQGVVDGVLEALDGTGQMRVLGANTTTAVSIATARAAASSAGLEPFEYLGGPQARVLPVPLLNVINGGVHAGNDLAIQEFMIIPAGFDSFHDAMRAAVEIYHTLKGLLREKYGPLAVNVGDEGGFAPPLGNTREALDLLVDAIAKAGYEPGGDVFLGLDAAASQFYRDGSYHIDGSRLSPAELLAFYEGLISEYPIVYLEDPFHEDAFQDYAELTRRVGDKVLVTGDDLYTTNVRYLEEGARMGATNSVLVKINQVGTLTRTLDFVWTARNYGMKAVISHRSGDTEDPFIADLAVGLGTGLIKTGAPARGERTAKYNRLLIIEDLLAGSGVFAGLRVLPRGRV